MVNLPKLIGKIRIAALFCLLALLVLGPVNGNAVDFVLRQSNGVFHFECVNSCGPVRARKSGKCEFFVQSIYYNGTVKACEVEIAARKACGELDFDEPKRKDLLNPACL